MGLPQFGAFQCTKNHFKIRKTHRDMGETSFDICQVSVFVPRHKRPKRL